MTTNSFVITNEGLFAASLATPTGPYIDIVSFKLGDNATTPASVNDTRLIGNTVYSGIPQSFSYYDSQTIQINLEVAADIGPFDYGELGLYLPGDVLFARFSYGVVRTKQTSLSSGFANILRIKALLKLSQGPAAFNISSAYAQSILEVADFTLVNSPVEHLNHPVLIVHEVNDFQESTMLYRNEDTLWDIVNYTNIGTAFVTAAPSPTTISADFFTTLYQQPTENLGKYLIQTEGGYLRTISSISQNVATLSNTLNTFSLIGKQVLVYELTTLLLAEIVAGLGKAGSFPNGTRMSFNQTTPPTGWVKDISPGVEDSLLRLVTGPTGQGGTLLFSSWSSSSSIGPSIPYTGPSVPGAQGALAGIPVHDHELKNDIKYIDFIIATKGGADLVLPVSSFFPSTVTGSFPLSVSFTDTSINNPTGWLWDFADGLSSTIQNPSHTFNLPGVFPVTLTVSPGNSRSSRNVTVSLPSPGSAAAFTYVNNSSPPLSVTFTDTSTNNPTSWLWDFGDGTTSTVRNPSKTYAVGGSYSVKLTVANSFGGNFTQNTVNVAGILPTVSFSASPTVGTTPLSVVFTDTSSGNPTSWYWNFGDGGSSTQKNPSHVYTVSGTYTVTLTATNATGGNTLSKAAFITSSGVAVPPSAPVADFTSNPTSGNSPLTVTFTDTSTNNPTSWLWDFGDGTTSTQQNP